nr:immunoglobulin light chain junction region [Macaca mulatta]
RMQALQTPFTF